MCDLKPRHPAIKGNLGKGNSNNDTAKLENFKLMKSCLTMMSDHGAVELNNQNLSDFVSVSVVNVIAS